MKGPTAANGGPISEKFPQAESTYAEILPTLSLPSYSKRDPAFIGELVFGDIEAALLCDFGPVDRLATFIVATVNLIWPLLDGQQIKVADAQRCLERPATVRLGLDKSDRQQLVDYLLQLRMKACRPRTSTAA